MVRSTAQAEAEWDAEDRATMAALTALDADTCHGCGGWLSETTTDEAAHRDYRVQSATCHRCVSLGEMTDAYKNDDYRHARRFSVEG